MTRRRVNRSLTRGELAILRRVNTAVRGKNESRLLSDSLLREFPQVHAEKSELSIADDDADLTDIDPMRRVLLGLVAVNTDRAAR